MKHVFHRNEKIIEIKIQEFCWLASYTLSVKEKGKFGLNADFLYKYC